MAFYVAKCLQTPFLVLSCFPLTDCTSWDNLSFKRSFTLNTFCFSEGASIFRAGFIFAFLGAAMVKHQKERRVRIKGKKLPTLFAAYGDTMMRHEREKYCINATLKRYTNVQFGLHAGNTQLNGPLPSLRPALPETYIHDSDTLFLNGVLIWKGKKRLIIIIMIKGNPIPVISIRTSWTCLVTSLTPPRITKRNH